MLGPERRMTREQGAERTPSAGNTQTKDGSAENSRAAGPNTAQSKRVTASPQTDSLKAEVAKEAQVGGRGPQGLRGVHPATRPLQLLPFGEPGLNLFLSKTKKLHWSNEAKLATERKKKKKKKHEKF